MIRIAALALAVATAAEPPRALSLLVWGDLHGDPSPKLFSWVDSLRRKADAQQYPLLALDAGDAIFGSDLAFASRGTSQATVLNLVQPDAMTLGTRDFWWSRDRLDSIVGSLQTPVLTSNILHALSDKPYGGRSWAMWDFDGLRVGVIGVADPVLDAAERPSKAYDLRANDPPENVPAALEALRERKVDLVVVLSHAGADADAILARTVPGIHLIVGARDESQTADMRKEGDTWIVRAPSGSSSLKEIEIALGGGTVSITESLTSPPAGIAIVPEWKPTFDSLATFLKSKSETVAGTLPEPWPKTAREGHLGNFLADALRHESGADIAFWPASAVIAGLPKGKVTMGDLWKTVPPPEQVSLFELPGSDVQKVLLRQMRQPKEFLFLSGASCTSDSSRFGGSPIQVFVDGKPIQSSGRYKIAIPLSVRNRIYDLTGLSLQSAGPVYMERWDRDMIEKYAREKGLATTLGRVPAMYGASAPAASEPAKPKKPAATPKTKAAKAAPAGK